MLTDIGANGGVFAEMLVKSKNYIPWRKTFTVIGKTIFTFTKIRYLC